MYTVASSKRSLTLIPIFSILFFVESLYAQDWSKFGYHRVATANPKIYINNPERNSDEILALAQQAQQQEVHVLVFPELSLTGYTAADLFLQSATMSSVKSALIRLKRDLPHDVVTIVGAPLQTLDGRLYNAAVVFYGGKIVGAVPKTHLPNYGEFQERRWFTSGRGVDQTADLGGISFRLSDRQLFKFGGMVIGIEICEDLWAINPPSNAMAIAGAQLIVNLSASPDLAGKAQYRRTLVEQSSARLQAAYVYASAGPWESSLDLVFGGHSMIYESGTLLAEAKRFDFSSRLMIADIDVSKIQSDRVSDKTFGDSTSLAEGRAFQIAELKPQRLMLSSLTRNYDRLPFVPKNDEENYVRSIEILEIQSTALVRRLLETKSKHMVLGLSGGLDSTLALVVMKMAEAKLKTIMQTDGEVRHAFNGIAPKTVALTMPGFGTTQETLRAAHEMARAFEVEITEIDIRTAVSQHLRDISHEEGSLDITFENAQARERTQILFDVANKIGGIVVGTGDLSELCLGWCTYNGDHMASYGVNAGVPKTLVKSLIRAYMQGLRLESANEVSLYNQLRDLLNRDISPELLPPNTDGTIAQKTEDKLGPYEVIDFFIYHFLRNKFSPAKIRAIAHRTYSGIYDSVLIDRTLVGALHRFSQSQFKRDTLPGGPKIGSVSVSPRGSLRLPTELRECRELFQDL